jgi:hypothetical protein
MNTKIRLLFLIVFLFAFANIFGQTKVVLEQVQIFSSINPSANYWKLPNDIHFIENALDTGLFYELNLERVKEFKTISKNLTKQSQVGKIVINWDSTRNIQFHAYVELYELDPLITYDNRLVNISEQKKDSIHSIWAIVVDIFNDKHDKIFQKTLMLGIIPIQNIGIGYEADIVATIPKNLFQAIGKGVNFIETESKDLSFIEANVPTAFFTDNYWMPLIHNQPRISLDTNKQFISYNNTKGSQLLRIPSANLYKIDLKNKSSNYPYREIITAIKKTKSFGSSNEYYQVIQSLRDVYANKDYTIKSFLEFNPVTPILDNTPSGQALQFVNGIGNIVYNEKDSIGWFNVKESVTEDNKFIYTNKVFNGYDSTKQFELSEVKKSTPIIHSRVITGKLNNQNFAIQFDNGQSIKTILVNDKVIMVIQGDNKPRHMVELPNAVSNQDKNLLLLIAYGELFQSPK